MGSGEGVARTETSKECQSPGEQAMRQAIDAAPPAVFLATHLRFKDVPQIGLAAEC